jgi:hypothetical protein
MHIPAGPAERSRPGMSTDRITAAALQIVDTEGSQALTMRRLRQALGRKVMTLYRYVPSKDALLDGVVARVSPTSPSTALPLTGGRNCATSPAPSGASRPLTQRGNPRWLPGHSPALSGNDEDEAKQSSPCVCRSRFPAGLAG